MLQFADCLELGVFQMRFILTLALGLSLTQTALAAPDLDVTAGGQLRLLELKYFEHTFDSENTEERVERIEKLVRGEAGQGDLTARVKSIVATLVAEGQSLTPFSPSPVTATGPTTAPASQKNASSNTANVLQPNNSNSTAGSDRGSYPHVTNLEKEILKKTYEGEPLNERLIRLEIAAFGQSSSGNDYGGRTDKLEEYAELVLHDKPFAVNPDIEKPYIIPASQPRQSYPVGSIQGAENYAVQHFFAPAHRFGGDFSSPALDTPTDNPVTGAAPLDDPEIYQQNPPSPGTRMLTRVAWCEQQLFGHTCPQMHLTRRLRQLNDLVHAVPSTQTDLDLMDDMDPIENAVLARRASQHAISSGSNAGTH